MSPFDVILIALAALASIPIAVIAVETFVAIWPRRPRAIDSAAPRPSCAILIPAHNEEAGIAATLAALLPQLRDGDRPIVVADNCSDGTAAAARTAGAEAIERSDADRRGKGYALAFGLNHLKADPPPIVVLIDADTIAKPGALDRLVRAAAARNGPIQGVFVDAPHGQLGPREQWSAFALTFKNFVRPLGLYRLGLSCQLTGSGMAFPWSVFHKVELGTGNIVEDMKLGIDLALVGHPARFCPDARFESDDAPSLVAATQRRTRWEHGHVSTLLTQTPRLVLAGLFQLKPRLIALALELAVPPLSLLFMGQAILLTICLVWWQFGDGSAVPALILLSSATLAAMTILTAWAIFGRRLLSPKILCLLPVYILWKLPIYLKLVIAPQRQWVRTERKPVP